MSITRWDPFGEMVTLRDAMERLLSDSVVRPRESAGTSPSSSLAVDIRDAGDDFVVTASTPGVNQDDVDITVLGDTLRIRGERRDQQRQEGEGHRWIVREQRFGSFERVIRLPSAVKTGGAQAKFKDGMLTITLPKADEAKLQRIPVTGGGQSAQPQEVPVSGSNDSAQSEASSPSGSDASSPS